MVRMGSGPDASALEKLDEYLFDGEEGDDEGSSAAERRTRAAVSYEDRRLARGDRVLASRRNNRRLRRRRRRPNQKNQKNQKNHCSRPGSGSDAGGGRPGRLFQISFSV